MTSHVHPYYIDADIADELAREALASRPHPSHMRDDRLYTTHAPILSWAENGDDLVSESNYRTVRDYLEAYATQDGARVCDAPDDQPCPSVDYPDGMGPDTAFDCECSESVIDALISDWLVGPLRQIFVRTHWADGTVTQVWIEACKIMSGLQDYPLFDESDYSELEWARFNDAWDDEINAILNYGMSGTMERYCGDVLDSYTWGEDDDDSDLRGIVAILATCADVAMDRGGAYDAYRDHGDVRSWIEDNWPTARDAYFEKRAREAMGIGAENQIPGQLDAFGDADGGAL